MSTTTKHAGTLGPCPSCEDTATRTESIPYSIPPKTLLAATARGLLTSTLNDQYVMYLGSFTTTEYRGCWKHVVDSRDCGHEVYLIVTYAGVDQYISAIRECAIGCGIAALIAAIATEGAGGVIATGFLECAYECVKAKIGDLIARNKYELRVVGTGCSHWSGH